ncbi:MAG: cytochrome P450 [Chloroflexota bacterium]
MATMSAPVTMPPGPKGMPILGNLNEFRRKGTLNFYMDIWKQYGDVASMKLGPLSSYMFVRPEHIQYILVKNPEKYVKGLTHDKLRVAIGNGILTLEGDSWYRQRKLMQPTYTPKNIRQFSDMMVKAAQQLDARWAALTPGQTLDINLEMTRVTMSVISQAMFGVDLSENYQEAAKALFELLIYTNESFEQLIDLPLFIPTARNQRMKQARQLLREFIFSVIRQRREQGLQDDLLSMLMSSRDADTGEFMTDDQLHDEVLITFFAGHETTASLLTWTFYQLSKNPDVEAKLHEELDSVLNGQSPTLEDMPRLPYTKMVLNETLRLLGPVPIIARDSAVDDEVEGYSIRKGSMIVVVPYATHRHPEFWEKPLAFYPEHFTAESVNKRPRYAYFPFGSGQRICIGQHFAEMEGLLMLAEIAQRFRVRLAKENDGALKYAGVIRPLQPIIVTVEPRLH